jgi:hypothetical protein
MVFGFNIISQAINELDLTKKQALLESFLLNGDIFKTTADIEAVNALLADLGVEQKPITGLDL